MRGHYIIDQVCDTCTEPTCKNCNIGKRSVKNKNKDDNNESEENEWRGQEAKRPVSITRAVETQKIVKDAQVISRQKRRMSKDKVGIPGFFYI